MDMYISPIQAAIVSNCGCHYEEEKFNYVPNAGQYKGSDYANAVRVERGITLEEAKKIAISDPDIDYFMFVKGGCLVLEFEPGQAYDPEKDPLHLVTCGRYQFDNRQPGAGYMRVFYQGDVVFFKDETEEGRKKWIAGAPGLADIYEKVK